MHIVLINNKINHEKRTEFLNVRWWVDHLRSVIFSNIFSFRSILFWCWHRTVSTASAVLLTSFSLLESCWFVHFSLLFCLAFSCGRIRESRIVTRQVCDFIAFFSQGLLLVFTSVNNCGVFRGWRVLHFCKDKKPQNCIGHSGCARARHEFQLESQHSTPTDRAYVSLRSSFGCINITVLYEWRTSTIEGKRIQKWGHYAHLNALCKYWMDVRCVIVLKRDQSWDEKMKVNSGQIMVNNLSGMDAWPQTGKSAFLFQMHTDTWIPILMQLAPCERCLSRSYNQIGVALSGPRTDIFLEFSGPRWLPIIGVLPLLHKLHKIHKFYHLIWYHLYQSYGSIVGLRVGSDNLMVVSGKAAIKEFYSIDAFNGRPDGFFYRIRSFNKRLGVVFSDGEWWDVQRKFSVKILRQLGMGRSIMIQHIEREAHEMVQYFRKHSANGQTLQMQHAFDMPVLNILWALLAGHRWTCGICFKKYNRLLAVLLKVPIGRWTTEEADEYDSWMFSSYRYDGRHFESISIRSTLGTDIIWLSTTRQCS